MNTRTEIVTQEEFDNMKEWGLIGDDGKLTEHGQTIVFGQLPPQDVTYQVGQVDEPTASG